MFSEQFFHVLQEFSKSSQKYWQKMFGKISLCRWLFHKNNNTINCDDNNHLAVLAVLHLCLLRFSPQHKSSCSQLLYITHFFLSVLFLCFLNLELRILLLFVPSVLSCALFCSLSCPSFYSFLLGVLFSVLFSPSAYSLYFLTSLIVFFSNLLSFLFSLPITLFCLLLPYVLLLSNLFSFY